MSQLIAIKLGSSNTSIYKQGEGLVLFEPTMVAYSVQDTVKTVLAVGTNAKKMQGRTEESVIVASPVSEGRITDPDLATAMLKIYLSRIIPSFIIKPRIRAVVCVPIGLTHKEKKLIELVCNTAGIQDAIIIPAVMAGAIGYNLPVSEPGGLCLVNIGGGSTDIAIVSVNSIISGINLGVGGITLDRAIEKAIEEVYRIRIGAGVAESVKEEIGSLYARDASNTEVSGVDLESGLAKCVVVDASVVYAAIVSYYDKIADGILAAIKECPANIMEDVQNRGVFMMGGASLITGAEQYFRRRLNLPVIIQDETTAVDVLGAGKLLSEPKHLKELAEII